jgi:predicted DNA-binding transcriptional regulator AlpA
MQQKLSPPEAAQYLGLSASTLSKRRVFGGGPQYLKLGRRVVYDTRDLDAWLDAHRRTSTSDALPENAGPMVRVRRAVVDDATPTSAPSSGRAR